MPNRAQRRRQARHRQPVVIAGDGIVARALAGAPHYRATRHELPPKRPGEHRWIALAMWSITADQAAHADDVDRTHLLDHENLLSLAIGCYDCEAPLGEIRPGSPCPAEDGDR